MSPLSCLLLASLALSCVTATHVTLFDNIDFRGREFNIENLNGCHDLHGFFKEASSINTHNGCAKIWSLRGCIGLSRTIAPGFPGDCSRHGDLRSCDFNDLTESVGPC